MSFDGAHMAGLIAEHGPVVRVTIAAVRGSAPREAFTSMIVWEGGQTGTIGGGTLEFDAAKKARALLARGQDQHQASLALGPDMGQCCGGRVTLLWDRFDTAPSGDIYLRQGAGEMPLTIARTVKSHRNQGLTPTRTYENGWLIEPMETKTTPVWIWGAGHVGRALVPILAGLPNVRLTWLDTGAERFPGDVPGGVRCLPAPKLAEAVRLAPPNAHHIVMTYSHALDLAICDGLLSRGFTRAGVIGSDTKWARFTKRLHEAGHGMDSIARIDCPIGDKSLGKHPAMIAVGVARDIAADMRKTNAAPAVGDEGDRDAKRLSGD